MEITVLIILVSVCLIGLWLTLVVLRRTLKWVVRAALAGGLAAALLVGLAAWFFWWKGEATPRNNNNRPANTRPR